MRTIKLLLLFLVGCVSLSCSDEDGYTKWDNQENHVVIKIYSNVPDVPVELRGGHIPGDFLTIRKYWENSFTTTNSIVAIVCQCEDKTVLLTGEIYVNGHLKERMEANSYFHLSCKVK